MDRKEHVLLIGADPGLRQEFDGALNGLGARFLPLHARDLRQGLQVARDWRPTLVCLLAPERPADLRDFAQDLSADVPESRLAIVYGREMFTDGDAESGYLLAAVRSGVADMLRRPLSSTELQDVLFRLTRRDAPSARESGRLVAFVSNKGGVGKSTLAVSVACAAARLRPGRVLLVDASVQLGVAAFMLDLHPEATLLDAVRERDRLDETLLMQLAVEHECGLRVLAAPASAVEAAEIDAGALARVLTLAKRTFDLVIVDTFPMLDGLVLAVLDLADLTYVVTQGSVPGVVGIARLIATLEGLGTPPATLRVVLNRIHPAHAGRLTEADVAERLGRRVDHVVPWQRRLLSALDSGRPYVLRTSRFFGFGRAVHRMAREVIALPEGGRAERATAEAGASRESGPPRNSERAAAVPAGEPTERASAEDHR